MGVGVPTECEAGAYCFRWDVIADLMRREPFSSKCWFDYRIVVHCEAAWDVGVRVREDRTNEVTMFTFLHANDMREDSNLVWGWRLCARLK